jgi:xanthine dehydrogenase accessory factor
MSDEETTPTSAAVAGDHGASVVPWLEPLASALDREERAVLVVVATTQGSAPRETGAAMVVSQAACIGSVGGGHLEYEAIRIARDSLAVHASAGTTIVRFPLAARLGQCCGGVATLAFSNVDRHARAWVDAAIACARTGAPFAVVTVIAPNAADARMVVTADDARGTLGASALDSAAIALARTRLAGNARGAALVRYTDDADTSLLIQVERPDPFPVLVFGNGHVGRALVNVLGVVPAQVRWIDSRGGDFSDTVPANVEIVVSDAPEDELREAPAGAFVVVTTHSHALDFTLIEAALARDDWRYLGLIGSKAKRAQFERRLASRGHDPGALARVHCPIGVEGVAIRGKHPGAIAVAIAAELLVVHEAGARQPALHSASR